jgi:hypothetical protein
MLANFITTLVKSIVLRSRLDMTTLAMLWGQHSLTALSE